MLAALVLSLSAAGAPAADAVPEGRGSVAILREPGLPRRGAPSDPARLASVLRRGGFSARLVSAPELARLDRLGPRPDLVVLPYGPVFPAPARGAFLRYLRAGGAFLSAGGYAFDLPVWPDGRGGWTERPPEGAPPFRLNTRFGRAGDTLRLAPDQIGIFDPSYTIERAVRIEGPGFAIDGPVEGFAAVALTGSNSPVFPRVFSTWRPLAVARDRYGLPRGPAGAIVHNHAGPFAGSSWAFFGVTNRDLFAPGGMPETFLLRIAEELVARLSIARIEAPACLRPGEEAEIAVTVRNSGRKPRPYRLGIEIAARRPAAGAGGRFRSIGVRAGTLPPGRTERLVFPAMPRVGEGWFLEVRARLADPGDRFGPIEARTGIVVWNPETEDPAPGTRGMPRGGLALRFAENHFEANGRPVFLTGANQTGVIWYSEAENPLVWLRDIRAMADGGLVLLRILHFSPFARGGPDSPRRNDPLRLAETPPDGTLRKTDALVRIARACGVAVWLTLHDWMPVDLADRELEAQRVWARFWARRYARVPSMVYDVQNEPRLRLEPKGHVKALWKAFLEAEYGSVAAASRAWGVPEARALDLEPGGGGFVDLEAHELERFRAWLADRWARANRDAVHEVAPEAPVTVGLIQFQHAMDQILIARAVDFACMHYYGPLEAFPARLKWIDRSAHGKGFSLGEFGALEAHDARVRGETGDPWRAGVRRFLLMNHWALGLGAAFTACWDMKEMPETVFPWGIRHRDGTPKRVAEAYRAVTLLFRRVEPVSRPPAVHLLIPDGTRLGAGARRITEALYGAIDRLIGLHVPFGILNEFDLDRIPQGTRAILWPLAYAVADETFEKIARFVERGGHLYLSGDPRHDLRRSPTRTARYARLGLAAPPPHDPLSWKGEVPPVARTRSGRGSITFVPAPLERAAKERAGEAGASLDARARAIYRRFLEEAGAPRIEIEPDRPDVHAFRVPCRDGGSAHVLVSLAKAPLAVRIPRAGIAIELGPRSAGFALLGRDGSLLALEGRAVRDGEGREILRADAGAMAITLDGRDLRRARRILAIALGEGRARLAAGTAWTDPHVEVGIIEGGAWRHLETLPAAQEVAIDGDRAFRLILAADGDPGTARRAALDLLRL